MRKSLETYDASGFVVGCTIDLGVWCCEIGTPISEDDYISGRVFLNTTKVEKKSVALSAPVSSRRFTLHSTTDQPLSTGPKTYVFLCFSLTYRRDCTSRHQKALWFRLPSLIAKVT